MIRSTYIRLFAAVTAVALVFGSGMAPSFAADVSTQAIPDFTFTGTGYGHGIGLSQYGSQGYALAGKTYDWIIPHYYSGTTIGTVTTPDAYVNIDCAFKDDSYPGRPYWTIRSVGSKLKVWRTTTFDPTIELDADVFYRFVNDGTNVIIYNEAGTSEIARFNYDVWAAPASSSSGLIEIKEKSTSTDGAYHPLDSSGMPTNGYYNVRYRGRMKILRKANKRLMMINRVSMQAYLYGVVPRESPASWQAEALKSQAVAARSYAHADVANGSTLKCTTYSQVYKGHSRLSQGVVEMHEDPRTNAAVDATNTRVVKYGSTIVKAYFFSTSGGHTANVEDVWVPSDGDLAKKAAAYPYLRGVEDKYEYLADPSYAPWPDTKIKHYDGLEIANRLRGLTGVPASPTHVTGIAVQRADSGHVRYATFTFSNGVRATITGDTVRSRLGLLSTVFSVNGFPIERYSGPTRYDTAIAISSAAFPGTAPAVVLASGDAYPDALTGSALAGAAQGALLLSTKDALPSMVRGELVRLAPTKVYIMGSVKALSTAVEDAVRAALPSAQIVRIAGEDRYETAKLAADETYTLASPGKAIVVSGTNWPDAVSVSALSYAKSYPILLVPGTGLGEDATTYLAEKRPGTTLVIGGTTVIAASTESAVALASGGATKRLAGPNRYATAKAVADYSVSTAEMFTYNKVYMATGLNFPDGLTGGVLAGKNRHPVLLTCEDVCAREAADFLTAHKTAIETIYLFGGTPAISSEGLDSISDVMMR